METLLPILTCITIAVISFFTGKLFSKIIKPTSEELMKYSIEHTHFLNTLNPIVKLIYLQFIQKEQLKYFFEDGYYLHITNLNIELWSANCWYSRDFKTIPIELLKEHNLTLKELNNTLSVTDKKILDHIVQAIKVNNKEFINRLFL
jgi:hypothetical protein